MAIVDGIEEFHIDRANDFLDALMPWSPRWLRRGGADAWFYRGQRDAAWTLQPSAMRPGAFSDPTDPAKKLVPRTADEQISAESLALSAFMGVCDRAGLALPEDGQWYRSPDLMRSAFPMGSPALPGTGANFPFPLLRSLYALAQHHGVPTRLLDWSASGLVAAYFACVKVAKDPALLAGAGNLAVWAVHRDIFKVYTGDKGIAEVTAPYAGNPNLRAQSGVFSLVHTRVQPAPAEVYLPTLDAMVRASAVAGHQKFTPPLLTKLTLPHKQAAWMLSLLNDARINAATIFPGYDGAVEALREKEFHARTVP